MILSKLISFDAREALEETDLPNAGELLQRLDDPEMESSDLRLFGIPIATPLLPKMIGRGIIKDLLQRQIPPKRTPTMTAPSDLRVLRKIREMQGGVQVISTEPPETSNEYWGRASGVMQRQHVLEIADIAGVSVSELKEDHFPHNYSNGKPSLLKYYADHPERKAEDVIDFMFHKLELRKEIGERVRNRLRSVTSFKSVSIDYFKQITTLKQLADKFEKEYYPKYITGFIKSAFLGAGSALIGFLLIAPAWGWTSMLLFAVVTSLSSIFSLERGKKKSKKVLAELLFMLYKLSFTERDYVFKEIRKNDPETTSMLIRHLGYISRGGIGRFRDDKRMREAILKYCLNNSLFD